jgi:Meiotically up-regulated gene 113
VPTYFIRCDASNRIKIGRSDDPVQRCTDLEAAGSGKLTLIGSVTGDCELRMHRELKKFRVHREWFTASETVINAVARELEIRPDIVMKVADSRPEKPKCRQSFGPSKQVGIRLTEDEFERNYAVNEATAGGAR